MNKVSISIPLSPSLPLSIQTSRVKDSQVQRRIICFLCTSCKLTELPQGSQAPAAAAPTILSPTSSPWGALPSPWPHPWPSPATPCITAVKMKTLQRPLPPPDTCMTRDPKVPPSVCCPRPD
ncbi:hypothetical protein LDENG_00123500 [Lucifuga dentata]|nr:hypothetical protein LDENG_00123500 [Lucifuga dentata]